jgi:hypothetical protein
VSLLSPGAINDGDDNLESLIVEFDLPPGVWAIGRWLDFGRDELVPARPVSNLARMGMTDIAAFPVHHPFSGVSLSYVGDTLRVSLPEREVRPRTGARLHAFTLLAPAEAAGSDLHLNWRGHSSDRRGVAEGVVTVRVRDEVSSIAQVLALEPAF